MLAGLNAEDADTTVVVIPQGIIESQRVRMDAPIEACEAYLAAQTERVWRVNTPSRGAWVGQLFGVELSAAHRTALSDPTVLRVLRDSEGLEVRPPLAVLQALTPAERESLYAFIAAVPGNHAERWPLVFPRVDPWSRFDRPDIPAAVGRRIEALCYPFAGGWALSDFSVIVAEFPDRDLLIQVLQVASEVDATIPRLRLRDVAPVAEALSYWTVNHQNAFALPLLETLWEADTAEDIDLIALLPGLPRTLSNDLDASDVRFDFSASSLMVSASLSVMPIDVLNRQRFRARIEQGFRDAAGEQRFGDLLVLDQRDENDVAYACAVIAGDIVFAKDPVGLGLWRFMRRGEVLNRNPHFKDRSFTLRRFSPPPVVSTKL